MLLKRPIRTRFRYGSPTRVNLATQRKLAGSFFKRHAVTPTPTSGQPGSDGLEAHGFRYDVPPRQGYFSPFPHGTCPLSVIKEYLGLTGGPARFTRNFTSSVILGYSRNGAGHLRLRGYHPLRRRFPTDFNFTTGFSLRTRPADLVTQTPQPHTRNPCRVSHVHGLASSDFARHYSRNHCCCLFLWVLRCFTSPRSLPTPYTFRCR